MTSRLSFELIRRGRSCVGGTASHSISAVPASSCCWTLSAVSPSVTVIRSTYALRIGSVFGSHAGFRSSRNSFVGTYFTIL